VERLLCLIDSTALTTLATSSSTCRNLLLLLLLPWLT
jgi:hypothetical protein